MPFEKVQIRPGVNTMATQTLNEGGWSTCNLVRFKNGFLQKVGGWRQLTETTIAGTCRAMHAFEDLTNFINLCVGTDSALQIWARGALTSVGLSATAANRVLATTFAGTNTSTVITVSTTNVPDLTISSQFYIAYTISVGGSIIYPGTYTILGVGVNNFTFNAPHACTSSGTGSLTTYATTQGTVNVTVTLANHRLSFGDEYIVYNQISIGGLVLIGSYTVSSVTNANVFVFAQSVKATSTASAVENNNREVWYQTQSFPSPAPADWFLDNFGNFLTISYTNSPIYTWTPPITVGHAAVASQVTNGPVACAGSLVIMPQAQIMAFGVQQTALGSQDPLLLAWCDAGDFSTWQAASTNQAGTYRLSNGSKIISAIQAPQTTLIWTDVGIWSAQYIGPPLVYGFTELGTGCGIISAKARASLGRSTYWMGPQSFWVFGDNGVQPFECDVWDTIFPDLDTANQEKCWAWPNESFREIWFFYPSLSGATGECDKYVKVNLEGQKALWDYGTLARTAGIGVNVLGTPIAADSSRLLQQHEIGYDANGTAMTGVFAESGYFDIAEGEYMMLVDQLIPDMRWLGTTGQAVDLRLYATAYPGADPQILGPFSMTPASRQLSTRVRARQMAVRLDWNEVLGNQARLGAIRLRSSRSGKRP